METTLATATATFPGSRNSSAQALSAPRAQNENKTKLSFILLNCSGKEAVQGLDLSSVSFKHLFAVNGDFFIETMNPSWWALCHIHQLRVLNDCCSLWRCWGCWLPLLWRITFQRGGKVSPFSLVQGAECLASKCTCWSRACYKFDPGRDWVVF